MMLVVDMLIRWSVGLLLSQMLMHLYRRLTIRLVERRQNAINSDAQMICMSKPKTTNLKISNLCLQLIDELLFLFDGRQKL